MNIFCYYARSNPMLISVVTAARLRKAIRHARRPSGGRRANAIRSGKENEGSKLQLHQ